MTGGGGEILGIKVITAVAGFAGGMASLSMLPPMPLWRMAACVLTGVSTAAFVTPVVAETARLTSTSENGIAFLLGLTAMKTLPVIIEQSARLVSKLLLGEKRNGY